MARRTLPGLCAALLAAALVGTLALTGPAPAGAAPSASDSARPAATTTGAPAERRTRADVLKRNKLYRLPAMTSAGCAAASTVPLDTSADLLAYYRSVLPCLDAAWKGDWKKLRKAGYRFQAPKLKVHDGSVRTKCGTPGALSFYCPANHTIYMYDAEIVGPWNSYAGDDYAHGSIRLAATHTLAHEYGHHVQTLVGMFDAIGARYRGNLERRAELQASCLGNVFLSSQRDAYPILADYAQHPEYWRYIEVANHGSVPSQAYWTDQGYATATPGACNTFMAPAAQVS
ncbi:hypothetical protein G5V58_24000 [Nocardioides anomalus]|uniref:Metalloprotease n=1 Tax=Nocardioides anomalus TaxID=2712223 RepID=A0A6G6WJT6_9ACTN|nr:neutral zinc metallopeptidase [Nocardioides anomalus]QIG45403.1 hypothetical protein G5V58_24000 [Nocardioides anomalus]